MSGTDDETSFVECGKNIPRTNARKEITTKLIGLNLFPTGNQVVKPTPQEVHRIIGTQTGTDESLEPVNNRFTMQTIAPKAGNNQSTTYVVPRGKRVVRIQNPPITYWNFVLRHAKKQRRLRRSYRRHPSLFQNKTARALKSVNKKSSLTFSREKTYYSLYPRTSKSIN